MIITNNKLYHPKLAGLQALPKQETEFQKQQNNRVIPCKVQITFKFNDKKFEK